MTFRGSIATGDSRAMQRRSIIVLEFFIPVSYTGEVTVCVTLNYDE
jgi:hypothetical protein